MFKGYKRTNVGYIRMVYRGQYINVISIQTIGHFKIYFYVCTDMCVYMNKPILV